MAGAAKVTTHVTDLTQRVQSDGTYASAIVIAAKKGPINTPVFVSGQTDFLNKFTPNGKIELGWDNAYLEAWTYLENNANLWIVRAANDEGALRALYAGCMIRSCNSPFSHKEFKKGFYLEGDSTAPLIPQNNSDRDYIEIPPETELIYESHNGRTYGNPYYNDSYGNKRTVYKLNGVKNIFYENDLDTVFTIYANSEGEYGNDLAVAIVTDKSIVKLPGCFIIRVYRKNELYLNELNISIKKGNKVYSNQYVKVEEHIVSLDPKMKDGYGVNCYLPEVLNASKYIRGEVNPLDEVVKSISYEIKVVGKAELKNPYIYANETGKLRNLRSVTDNEFAMSGAPFYNVGDIVKLSGDITWNRGVTAYYECTKAGYGSLTGSNEKDIRPIDDGTNDTWNAWTYPDTNEYKETVEDMFNGIIEIASSNGVTQQTIKVDGATWKLKERVVAKVSTSGGRDHAYTQGDVIETTVNGATEYYKAANSGVTSPNESKPNWYVEVDGERVTLDTVTDGIITWVRQKQIKDVFEKTGYSNTTALVSKKDIIDGVQVDVLKKDDEGKLISPIYEDEYLSTELSLPSSIKIDDTTQIEPEQITVEVKIIGSATGENTSEHYLIPKESSQVDGVYELTRLNGGFDGSAVTDAERVTALNKLDNLRTITAQLIMDGGNTTPAYARAIESLCSRRNEESHGIISTPLTHELGRLTGESVTDILTYRNEQLQINSRLMELYTTHQLIYDQFNDRQVYVSPSCFMAASIMKYARELGWHWAVAGYNRGVINSLGVAYDFNESELDRLSNGQVNMIIKETGVGIMNWEELTLLPQACDLQDAHIARWIDLYLRPALKTFLKGFLFEFNDDQTRFLISKRIDLFMKNELANRAVYGYRVVCDRSNNTDLDIENNILNSWLYIQPTKISKEIKQEIITTDLGTDLGTLSVV